jgi:hypothetical protein
MEYLMNDDNQRSFLRFDQLEFLRRQFFLAQKLSSGTEFSRQHNQQFRPLFLSPRRSVACAIGHKLQIKSQSTRFTNYLGA